MAQKTPNIDLDLLRGWKEPKDRTLRAKHAMPRLARLTGQSGTPNLDIHGNDLIIGRYASTHGPVDLPAVALTDIQRYTLGNPHLRLKNTDQRWTIETLSLNHTTTLNDIRLSTDMEHPIRHGDHVSMGHCHYIFETTEVASDAWQSARNMLLEQLDKPTLCLKRAGAICGPYYLLKKDHTNIIGRVFPGHQSVTREPWANQRRPDWNLSYLYDHERAHIGFQHLIIQYHESQWVLLPISKRLATFVNRQRLTEAITLQSGDEIALGAVCFLFHNATQINHEPAFDVPKPVNWDDGHAPTKD